MQHALYSIVYSHIYYGDYVIYVNYGDSDYDNSITAIVLSVIISYLTL